jgi:hypothetical protein
MPQARSRAHEPLGESPDVGGEARLSARFRLLRGDEAALTAYLTGELPPWQRMQARVVLARVLGPAQAHALTTRAFGADLALGLVAKGSVGVPLGKSEVERLAPHVGSEAAAVARIHTDEAAHDIAAAHRARALTVGRDIYFARGEFAPGTARGDDLLAHELTHVDQALRGELHRAAAKGIESGGALDASEAEAELKAKVAVVQLHYPDGAPPALASPAGQPTSEGEADTGSRARHRRRRRDAEPLEVDDRQGAAQSRRRERQQRHPHVEQRQHRPGPAPVTDLAG